MGEPSHTTGIIRNVEADADRAEAAADAIEGAYASFEEIETARDTAVTAAATAQAAAAGIKFKGSVKAATTGNITLSGEQTLDGIACVSGDRALAKDQDDASENGIYQVSAGAWSRTFDLDVWLEIPSATVSVEEGNTLADTTWTCTSDQGGTIDIDDVNWVLLNIQNTYNKGEIDAKDAAKLDVDGDGSQLANVPFPPGFVFNATVTLNVSEPANDIDVPLFKIRNDDDDANIVAPSAFTKQMDSTFVEGTNAGGMASGETRPTSGEYYVFAVSKDSDGTVDVMGDTSSTGANVNAGWTVEKLLARISTDGSAENVKVINYWKGSRWVFDSDEKTITAGATTNLEHGLGAAITYQKLVLICKLTDSGYTEGDIIDLSSFTATQSASGSIGAAMLIDETHIAVICGTYNTPNIFGAPNKSTAAVTFLTSSKWRMIVRAST
jgi:hypothetical protein